MHVFCSLYREHHEIFEVLGRRVYLSFKHDRSGSGSGHYAQDWICPCGVQNFARRRECFKCNAPKGPHVAHVDGGAAEDQNNWNGRAMASPNLVVRGLDASTNEEAIRHAIEQ